MKLLASLTILGLVMAQSVTAQTNYTKDPESCTSIMVGKKATTDGSVITSHTCDSWYRTWVNMVPAESYERDTVMNIYDGRMHTEFVADQTNVKSRGKYHKLENICLHGHLLPLHQRKAAGDR